MYIDGDTHYWPIRFIDKVSHPGKGYVEVKKDTSDFYIRFGERLPGDVATTIVTATRSILSRKDDGILSCAPSL